MVACVKITSALGALKTSPPGWHEEQRFGRGNSNAREVGSDYGGPCRSCEGCGSLAEGQ